MSDHIFHLQILFVVYIDNEHDIRCRQQILFTMRSRRHIVLLQYLICFALLGSFTSTIYHALRARSLTHSVDAHNIQQHPQNTFRIFFFAHHLKITFLKQIRFALNQFDSKCYVSVCMNVDVLLRSVFFSAFLLLFFYVFGFVVHFDCFFRAFRAI